MNTKILVSLLVIGLTAIAIGGGMTGAFFSDTETSNNNTFTAGSLDLLVNGSNWNRNPVITLSNLAPGTSGTAYGPVLVKNNGTIDGTLTIMSSNPKNYENGCTEPEHSQDNTCGNPGENEGELCDKINVIVYYKGAAIYDGPLTNLSAVYQDLGNLSAGEEASFRIDYNVDSTAENEIQTDSCVFNIELMLEQ